MQRLKRSGRSSRHMPPNSFPSRAPRYPVPVSFGCTRESERCSWSARRRPRAYVRRELPRFSLSLFTIAPASCFDPRIVLHLIGEEEQIRGNAELELALEAFIERIHSGTSRRSIISRSQRSTAQHQHQQQHKRKKREHNHLRAAGAYERGGEGPRISCSTSHQILSP